MRIVVALVAALLALPVFGQPTCSAITTTPTAARDETRLKWDAVTQNTDGTAVATPLTYKVYRATGTGASTVQCQTTATTVSLFAQPIGAQNYRVTATAGGVESAFSNVASKTIVAPTPNPPGNLTLLEQLIAWLKSAWSRWFA
jgi:hypothetical protein